MEDLTNLVNSGLALWDRVTSKVEHVASQAATNVLQITDQVDDFITSSIFEEAGKVQRREALPVHLSAEQTSRSASACRKVSAANNGATTAPPLAGGWDVGDDAWDDAADECAVRLALLCVPACWLFLR